MPVFFREEDRALYLEILAAIAPRCGVTLWAYCLMENHVHHVAVPHSEDALASTFGRVHSVYASVINRRHGWKGHLWQERFASFPMEPAHAYTASRYVLLNPVRAGLVKHAGDWPFSSARAHLGESPPFSALDLEALELQVSNWDWFLADYSVGRNTEAIRAHTKSGLPWGSETFVRGIENSTGRYLRAPKMGRPPSRERTQK